MAQPKPVPLYITSPVKMDGRHLAVGEVLPSVEPEGAFEIVGQGRARLATDDEVAKAAKKSKAAAE